jgi:cytochrome c5
MNQKDDRTFLRRFSGIVVGLIAITVVIIVLAFSLQSEPDPNANPSQLRLAEERIAPVAGVHVGAEGLAAIAAAEQTAAPPATAAIAQEDGAQPGTPAASSGPNGAEIYQTVCMACHAAGVAGAPIPGSELMAQRLSEKGIDGLIASSINGLNVMPPKGGRTDLSDDDMRAAVEFMLQ